jgi:hypothetical protein
MLEEKITFRILWKRFAGNNLKLFFGDEGGGAKKVLVLSEVVAFLENEFSHINSYVLQVREGKSVYGLDMSMRFKKPEYADYKEVFLFVEKPGSDFAFRALVKDVVWCDFDELTKDDLNY